MLKVVKRKTLAGVITLLIALLTYKFILFRNNDSVILFLFPSYFVGIFCGGILSLGIDYILSPTNHRFIFSLISHILIVLMLTRIFLANSFWESFFILFLPVGIFFFLTDEFIRKYYASKS